MKDWLDFLGIKIDDRQVETDIACPECGGRIFMDNFIVLPTYPVKYKYWCPCGWEGTAQKRWVKGENE